MMNTVRKEAIEFIVELVEKVEEKHNRGAPVDWVTSRVSIIMGLKEETVREYIKKLILMGVLKIDNHRNLWLLNKRAIIVELKEVEK